MSLRVRLLVHGVALPLALLALAFAGVGVALDRVLTRAVDDALLTQAAVESVSLFDALEAPHLHLLRSPLAERVRDVAPLGAIYGPDGALRLRSRDDPRIPARLPPADAEPSPEPVTRTHPDGTRTREIAVRVPDPSGDAHVLWLGASLAPVDATLRTHAIASALLLLLVGVLLGAVQARHARALDARVRALVAHLRLLAQGTLDAAPAPDPTPDELGALRDEIARTTERLREARAREERFIAEAAHELRTPVAAMRVAVDVTLRRERDADELRDALARLRDELGRLGALADRLLGLATARAAPLEAAPVDLRELVEEAVDAARLAASERGVGIEVDTPSDAALEADALRLRQAVDNLLHNAVRHAPEGSIVRVDLARATGPDGAPGYALRVTDTGAGVPEDAREAVFEPYQTTARGAGGVGLGLAIVREVARRHGGEARVAAPQGGAPGTTFVVWLPARGAPLTAAR